MNHEFKNKIKSRLYEQLANSLMEVLVDEPIERPYPKSKPTLPPREYDPIRKPILTTPTKPIRKPKPPQPSLYPSIENEMMPR